MSTVKTNPVTVDYKSNYEAKFCLFTKTFQVIDLKLGLENFQ